MPSYNFGKYLIPLSHIFKINPLTFCFVNLRPVIPGHILISPKRIVRRYSDLTDEEALELWSVTKEVAIFLEEFYKTGSEICVQDGENAGQTVHHVHIHVLPKINIEISAVDSGNV